MFARPTAIRSRLRLVLRRCGSSRSTALALNSDSKLPIRANKISDEMPVLVLSPLKSGVTNALLRSSRGLLTGTRNAESIPRNRPMGMANASTSICPGIFFSLGWVTYDQANSRTRLGIPIIATLGAKCGMAEGRWITDSIASPPGALRPII